MTDHAQIFELVPLYALDALDGAELTMVEGHIEECDICRAELDAHRRVAAEFVPEAPVPVDVWDRIQSSIGEAGSATVHDLGPAMERRVRPLMWLSAAAAVAVFAVGGILVGQRLARDDLATATGIVAAAEAAAGEPGTLVSDFLVDDVAVARVVLSADGHGYLIPTDDLETLDPSRTYQLWVLTPDELAISAGVLGNDPGPTTFTWNGAYVGLALSRETAGGVVSSEGDIISVVSEA